MDLLEHDAEKVINFVIPFTKKVLGKPSGARNFYLVGVQEKKERFFASLRMTNGLEAFSSIC